MQVMHIHPGDVYGCSLQVISLSFIKGPLWWYRKYSSGAIFMFCSCCLSK